MKITHFTHNLHKIYTLYKAQYQHIKAFSVNSVILFQYILIVLN